MVMKKKISDVLVLMHESLKHQVVRISVDAVSYNTRIEPYGREELCGTHGNCVEHRATHWKTISIRYPTCRARRYVNTHGIPFFVILSEFSELSYRLACGATECEAWEQALREIS